MFKRIILIADRIIEKISNWGLISSGILILIMAFLTTYGVGRRYLFNDPEPYSYELSTIFLTVCVVLAVSGLQRYKRHLRVDFIANYMSPKVQGILMDIVTPLLALVFVSIITWQSWEITMYSLSVGETSQSAWEEPLWPTKLTIPICMFWLCLVLLAQLIKGIKNLIRGVKPEQKEEEIVTAL
jgi:TRAP-type mannitol/chloroaromatic compound transport system permease small subunit